MRILTIIFLLFLSAVFQTPVAQVLIRNTQVVDVERKRILAGYDVVAIEGKIVSVDKGKMYKLPEGTTVIDGSGKWLVPGFTDAHVHFFQSGGLYARPDAIDLRKYRPYDQELKWVHDHMEDFLRLYSRSGITSVIDVGASYSFLRQRDSFSTKSYAPIISMTGPLLTTWVPPLYKDLGEEAPFVEMLTEENTRKAVRDQLPFKTDFIKIWYIVLDTNTEQGARKNLHLVKAAIDEAHVHNLKVAVHATEKITAQLAVEAGADFLVHNVFDQVVDEPFLQLLKKRNTVVCPTLVVSENYSRVLGDYYKFSSEELYHSHPVTVGSVLDYPWPDTVLAKRYISRISHTKQAAKARTDSINYTNLKKMADAGILIATGTDAGNTGTQHVGSYLYELKAMQAAGLDNWQLLQASTINGARAIGKEKEWGSIAKDKVANMVLLTANPIESINNWSKIDYIINKGKPTRPDSLVHFSPEMLAQQQLNAYNAHDLEAFLAPYAEDVEIYSFPSNRLQSKGKAEMRKNYEFITKLPELYCKLLNRVVQGNTVIDHEEIWGVPGSPHYGIAIYMVENGKIRKVYFPADK